jgi:glycosyltransferase involved in cell wall biosynthesis
MEIWAHTMVKNDARWLWYSVSSVIDYVDKLLLWDTGSTDGTLEIERELLNKYPDKIVYKVRKQSSAEEFTTVRQEMLDSTKSDWFIMLDGDEIWWGDTIRHLLSEINSADKHVESFVVPTVNVVGDIFHYQDGSAGMYTFGSLKGHYNLRAIKTSIPGLHSQGIHGVWGWADADNKMIQDRSTFKFVNAPYLHTTFLPRASRALDEFNVSKRYKKLKYEIGNSFPLDYYYPEVFFSDKPDFIISPWAGVSAGYKLRAVIETPLRHIKRKVWNRGIGY